MPNSESTTRLLVLLFTDLVDSSRRKVELGDAEYVEQIARPHNAIFRELLARFPGAEENNYTGDGFLATFRSVNDAVNFALLLHHALRTRQWQGVTPGTRIGIHLGDTVEFDAQDDAKLLASHAADMCARVMGLGDGGQTLLTRAAFDSARQYVRRHPDTGEEPLPEIQWLAHGRYLFKGREEPMEVFEVGAVGCAPLRAPANSEKARRALSPEEEQTLGWRPGTKLSIPGKPGWILQEKLGDGGFGEVWLAQQQRLKEQRVFKFCFDADRLRSFKRELTLFRLIQQGLGDRDDIARLLDVRIDQPPFFLESEYVAAGNLRRWCESQGGIERIPLETRLKLLADVVRAVAAAHSLGIIHKDIKPSNILIHKRADGTPHPKLADFGIGVLTDRALLAEHQVTETGFTESLALGNESSRTGTRLYSPPEAQVGKPASTAGDVYALGVMLYQSVTGDLSRPLGVGWEADVDDELLREDVSACTHRDPGRRLGSATELAERLEAIPARREAHTAQLRAEARLLDARRRLRRLKVGLAVALLLVLVAAGSAVWVNDARKNAIWQKGVADEQRNKAIEAQQLEQAQRKIAEEQTELAIAARNNALRHSYNAQMNLAQRDWESTNISNLLGRLEATRPEQTGGHDLRGFEWYYWHRCCHSDLFTLQGHDGDVQSVAFSPDGRRIVSGSQDNTLKVWDAATGEETLTLKGHTDSVASVAFSPDGARIVSGSQDNTLKVWDAATGEETLTLKGHTDSVASVAFSPDGARIASGSHDETVKVWDAATGQETLTLKGHTSWVRSVAFSPDGRRIVSGSNDTTLKVWDAATGQEALTLKRHADYVMSVAFSPDGRRIVSDSRTDRPEMPFERGMGYRAVRCRTSGRNRKAKL